MINIRYNTNYGKLPDQKRWRVLIDGSQVFTDSVEIKTKSWTTSDIIQSSDSEDVNVYIIKYHITCNPEIISKNDDGIQLKDYDDMKSTEDDNEPQPDLVCVSWSESLKKWIVNIKGEDRVFDDIFFKTNLWTSDISPELCCRPKHIGVTDMAGDKKTLYLSDTF